MITYYMVLIVSYILLFTLVLFILLNIVSKFINNVWFCNFLGWHREPTNQNFDGCSFHGECPVCKKHILQDSQGNWF